MKDIVLVSAVRTAIGTFWRFAERFQCERSGRNRDSRGGKESGYCPRAG